MREKREMKREKRVKRERPAPLILFFFCRPCLPLHLPTPTPSSSPKGRLNRLLGVRDVLWYMHAVEKERCKKVAREVEEAETDPSAFTLYII